MKKYIILVMCQVFFVPTVLRANMLFIPENNITETPSYPEILQNNELPGLYEWGSQDMNNPLLRGNQEILMAPALPGDIGGEFAPVDDSWLAIFILSFIYLMVRKFYFRKHQLDRKVG